MTDAGNDDTAPSSRALGLTWNTPRENLKAFWRQFHDDVFTLLQTLSAQGKIKTVLPFQHEPVRLEGEADKGPWCVCVVIVLSQPDDARGFAELLLSDPAFERFSNTFPLDAADLMRVQQNLDMYYPKNNGLAAEPRLLQWLEYVFSDARYRDEYYNTQYVFSGPAMRRMRSKNRAGRFLGFEIEERIRDSRQIPQWDVLHISGFTLLQCMKYLMFSRGEWDRQAKECWGESASGAEVMGQWEKQRVKIMPRAKQIAESTIQCADLAD